MLRINQRYFSSKKDSIELFSAYMQEVSFSIYITYVSVSGLMYAQEISASRFVKLCLGMVVSETSSYFTNTSYFLNTLLTTFLFTQPSIHT
jgi:hypothetical protein